MTTPGSGASTIRRPVRDEIANVIDVVDQQVSDWISSILEGVSISFEAPGRAQAVPPGINLYLFELRRNHPLSTSGRPPLQFNLRYLVTAWGDEAAQAHQLLGRIAFAAMENPAFSIEFEPVPAQTWSAFGLAPRPAFFLDVPVRKERPEPSAGLVRQPLIVNTLPLATLRGVVVGPGNLPMASARVEVPLLKLVATTDAAGAFHFTALPAGRDIQLEIHARGKAHSLTAATDSIGQHQPFIIQFPIGEE
jgi:Pvc16 N-terminal domain